MITLTLFNGETRQVKNGSSLLPLAQEFAKDFSTPIVEGVFNGETIDLQAPLDCDGTVDFIQLQGEDGMRVYVRTLLFLFLVTAKRLYPDVDIEVHNTLGSALNCSFKGEKKLSAKEMKLVEAEMRKLVEEKAPIKLLRITKAEALEKYGHLCNEDLAPLLCNIADDDLVTVYSLGDRVGYLFGALCPNAGYITDFSIVPFEEGFVLDYPAFSDWKELINFKDLTKLNAAFRETEEWAAMIKCDTISKLNRYIEMGVEDKIIQMAEALHEKKFAAIADEIAKHRDRIKIILIAGPSSSGKTSSTQRISIQLAVNGIRPIPISMDDYYVNRVDTPRKPNGDYDFETVDAIDLELFNAHLIRLLRGERVKIPKYNFQTGLREYRGNELQLTENSVLLVEGIHGLNDKLTSAIPAENKIKIYVSALVPLAFDQYNRINTTDVRLLRRMVRDSQFRSHDAVATLSRWADVREGEEKYIFPFQCSADVIMNTNLIYEMAVIKKYAEPLLEAVPRESGRPYMIAKRLLRLLKHVKSMDDAVIPNNSLLREFIGGSVFKEAL